MSELTATADEADTPVELILMRAADIESDIEDFERGVNQIPAVSVLDFGAGSFPWMVAEERPVIQPHWQVGM